MKKLILLLTYFLLFTFTQAQNAPFPYGVSIHTTIGDCYNNCGINISLINAQGATIPMNDSLHRPIDSVQYNLSQIQYYYRNRNFNSIFYSDSHEFVVEQGHYDVGVTGYIRIQNGTITSYQPIDTLIQNIEVSSTYQPLRASILANIAENNQNNYSNGHTIIRELSGNRNSLSCKDVGRIQLKIQDGKYPYFIDLICNGDTIRRKTFLERQHNGLDSNYADYKDFYTIDSLPAGNYRILIHDGCTYTLLLTHEVGLTTIDLSLLKFYPNYSSFGDSNIVRFRPDFNSHSNTIYNYYYPIFAEKYKYRFINPNLEDGGRDTTAWQPLSGNGTSVAYYDTIFSAHRYCDLYQQPITFQVWDFCDDDTASVTLIPKIISPNPMVKQNTSYDPFEYDTCEYYSENLGYTIFYYSYDGYLRTYTSSNSTYMHFYTLPLYWVYRDSTTHQVIKTDTINSIFTSSHLTTEEVALWCNTDNYTLSLSRTLYDAKGCCLYSTYDTLRPLQPSPTPYGWRCDHDNFEELCEKTITIFNSIPTQFINYLSIQLIESPSQNRYNFSAIYSDSTWNFNLADTTINATVSNNGYTIILRGETLPSGRYIFACESHCGRDTLILNINTSRYAEYEWVEESVYEPYQICDKLYSSTMRYRIINYYMNSNTGEITTRTSTYTPQVELVSGDRNGFLATSQRVMFTIPGDYVIRTYFYHCGEVIERFDSIKFIKKIVDFEKAYAIICDTNTQAGMAFIRAKDGAQPYTYSIYSGPELTGTCLGTNQTGLFYNLNIDLGQEISALVIDSCGSSYSLNMITMSISQSSLVWFEEDLNDQGGCEGDTIHLSALPFSASTTYSWTGPNGFTSTSLDNTFYIPQDCPEGYFVVELHNTGCQFPVKDSILLQVMPAPQIFLSAPDSICAGEEIVLTLTHQGIGMLHYNLIQNSLSQEISHSYTANTDDTLQIPFIITANTQFYVTDAHDSQCPARFLQDPISTQILPVTYFSDSSSIITENLLVCYNEDLQFQAQSALSLPYFIQWYEDSYYTHLLQQDTINSASEFATYTIPTLTNDTTLYLYTYNENNCPVNSQLINRWINICNCNTTLQRGESIRVYDSGGENQEYQNNESITHTFTFDTAEQLLLRINQQEININDTLFIYAGGGNSTMLIAQCTDTASNQSYIIPSSTVTLTFHSNNFITAEGWNIDIISNIALAETHAEVVRYLDTVDIETCQSEVPFHYEDFQHLDVTSSGEFTFDTLLFSQMGCDSMVHLRLKVLPNSTKTIDTIICEGKHVYIGDTSFHLNGIYNHRLDAANGCDSIITLNLHVVNRNKEIFSLYEDFCDQYMTILSFDNEGDGSNFEWSTGEQTQEITVTHPGTYTVTTSIHDCPVTGSLTIPHCEFTLHLPNAITPGNGDGLNDYFCIHPKQQLIIQKLEVFIYTRWGDLVYHSKDKDFKWDGSKGGKIFHNSTFSYVIYCTDLEGAEYLYKGSLFVF